MSNPLEKLRDRLDYSRRRKQLTAIYERFRDFTMIYEAAYITNLELAHRARKIPGCIVECGVWRGGMSAGIAALLGPGRTYFLFDSFEGLPPPKEEDGETARVWQEEARHAEKDDPRYLDNCRAGREFAEKAMREAGARDVHLVAGWFDRTLPEFKPPCPIALLRLDGDWYESTMLCLENLFDHVPAGGMILIDDYYTWDGCSRAVHDFLSRRSAPERIRNRGDVCYIVKS